MRFIWAVPLMIMKPRVPSLPRNVRCDKCGTALAVYRVIISPGRLWLDLCAHHFRELEPLFVVRGYSWEDKSGELK